VATAGQIGHNRALMADGPARSPKKPSVRRKPAPADGAAAPARSGRPAVDAAAGVARNARAVACELIAAVARRGKPLDEAITENADFARLEPRDRAFARELSATVFRRFGQIEVAINALLEKPLPAKAAGAQDLLRLGIAQLLFLRTPAHAAVSETVALATGPLEPWRSLVNAVLRRIAEQADAMREALPEVPTNTPNWLFERWAAAYGEATAVRIAAAHLATPPLDLSVREDRTGWARRLEAKILPNGSLRRESAPVETLPGFSEGAWWVQDAAAAMPAALLGAVRGRIVLDLCAAPGGKTAQLAIAGARVIAVDKSKERMVRLAQNMQRLGLQVGTVIADAATWNPPGQADAVLLDAPCSSTGTIRRHPDLPWLKRPSDLAALIGIQDAMLRNAVRMLKPDGLLVYAVCSLEPEEGPARIDSLLAAGTGLRRVPIDADEIGGLAEAITPAGDMRTLPCHWADKGGLDGFYAARLRRG
jgi:16S rRNA (cytosine967-C5)-methyltransferase